MKGLALFEKFAEYTRVIVLNGEHVRLLTSETLVPFST